MRYLYSFSLVALVLFAGCKKEEEEPVGPEAPPPPKTVQEIYSDYKAQLQPLLVGATTGFGYGMKDPVIGAFKKARSGYAQEMNEPEAANQIAGDVSSAISEARKAEAWYAIDGLLDVHKYLNPNSQRHDGLRQRTDLMLARPWVKVTGFAEIDAGDLITFLDVTDPETLRVESFKVREGEEFYPDAEGNSILRLVKVIGDQSAVELEYLKLRGEVWEVPGPKNN